MKNLKKVISFLLLISFVLVFKPCDAGPLTDGTVVTNPMDDTSMSAGFNTQGDEVDPQLATYVASIIKIFLTFLGIIFTVLIIYGGYIWMTAGGSEDKVQKAKDTIQRAVIGFVIVISAYAITFFVFESISNSSTSGSI